MMPMPQETITSIHQTPHRLVFEFAGAGSLALFWLHSVPGSSRTVLEATDRYAAASLADLIGATPEKFVSAATARAMAEAAYRRALRLTDGAAPCLGVACTAAIATDRVKRGDHGCSVAVYDGATLRVSRLTLAKGARDRAGEEALISLLIIRAIAEACGVAPPALALEPSETVEVEEEASPDPLMLLLNGDIAAVFVGKDGRICRECAPPAALLSGSFNPLHAGHEYLAQAAAVVLDTPVTFELPVLNADKPPLRYIELERRLDQFRGRYPVVLTRAPLFVQKADLFPGCTFVIGYDTALRIIDPRYYDGEAGRDAAFARIAAQRCTFLVAGRVRDGIFRTLADIDMPPALRPLFRELPERLFRIDLSSTAIRNASVAHEVTCRSDAA
ncbi:MAG: hypothetical protein K6T87_08690 [Roseiflexus sp.]|uniref:hypothetical protein n=1 Tax=Roseiflexus sp. TaxID=2562120 RepID=UPI0025DD9E6F|nr:hypothetical protein [Roseiflexus sp.]MCL6540649.1 hypothetical protein [Roseiflexus sp.]